MSSMCLSRFSLVFSHAFCLGTFLTFSYVGLVTFLEMEGQEVSKSSMKQKLKNQSADGVIRRSLFSTLDFRMSMRRIKFSNDISRT